MTGFLKQWMVLFTVGWILAACGSMPTQVSTADVTSVPANVEGDLVNTKWVLKSFHESEAAPPSLSTIHPYVEFRANDEAGGSGGCNTFSTQYEVQRAEISFGPIASTKMACTTDIMQEEQLFFDALGSANRYEVSGDILRIWYANGQSVLTFSRTTLNTPDKSTP